MKRVRKIKGKTYEHLFMDKDGSSFILREVCKPNKYRNFIITEFGELECLDPNDLIISLAIQTECKKLLYVGEL